MKFKWIKAVGKFVGGLRLPLLIKQLIFCMICAITCPVIFTAWLLVQPLKYMALALLIPVAILSHPVVLIRSIFSALSKLLCCLGFFAALAAAPFAAAYLLHAIWVMPPSLLILWLYVGAIDRRTRRTY